jgi:hypothetical protein
LRQDRLIAQARHFLAVSDGKNALLCLDRALASNAKDPNACGLMADLAETSHSCLKRQRNSCENSRFFLDLSANWLSAVRSNRPFAPFV